MDLLDEFTEIGGIGPYPIYQSWMKPLDRREEERMLQKERIARVRHWFVTQWNANVRMTVTERVKLRQDRMFWKRVGMRLYGVTDRVVPKLLKPGLDYVPDFCEHCFRDLLGKRCVCPRCGNYTGESRPVAKAKAYLPESRMREYIEILLGDS